ncbi:MAG: YIP1 family protein [Thermomicrobiales bacterium]
MSYLPPAPAPASAQPSHSFFDRVVGSVKLSRPIFDEVRRDPSAMTQAAIVVVLTGLLSGISQFAELRGQTIEFGDGDSYTVTNSFFGPLLSGIGVAIVALIFWVIAAVIFRLVAVKMLSAPETEIQWQEVARPLGFASAPGFLLILTPIPVLGFIIGSIVGLWSFAAQIVAMSETFRISKLRAFATILIASIGLGIFLALISCICIFAVAAFV